MKRRNKGIPPNTAAKHAVRNAAGVARAIATCPPAASDVALTYWRDKLWQAADSVGVTLTDDQLETMAADLVVAAKKAPGDE